ncbi:MAG: nucleotidyltransferase domain-containing protein [Calditrichaeota bacterium]|nr:MAG: nucleotidyltransferase domain-containing protein [Calditrichota bacterium]
MKSNPTSHIRFWREELERIVSRLVENYQPDLIVLFGSFAREEYSPESDLDLLIVKETDKRPLWRRVEVRKLIKTSLPVDIIVYTPQEFLALQQAQSQFLQSVLREGQILYERKVFCK